ncbi:MAG TPA: signal peptide peptidase SppA [Tepidisphaeraceae bacterium]|nr:signal peptide peptidase SppA [Tepidisphaeraceae bacterium]
MRSLFFAGLGCLLLVIGCGTPSFLVTPVSNTNELDEEVVQPGNGLFQPKIAIIEVEGLLANAREGGFLKPTENKLSLFVQELNRAEEDPDVKAVVLRVNSPGGTVSCADAMYQMIVRFRKKTGKPVVASIQEIGASGAYYVSCGADKIVAQPTSLVGSIGVIFETMDFVGTMEKLGIRSHDIKSGSLKDMGSPFKNLEPREEAVMQSLVEEYFARFIGVVRDNRPVTEKAADKLADYENDNYTGIYSGRVFSGEDAVHLGLIDQTGLLSDAIKEAKVLAAVPNAKAVMYRRPYAYGGSIYAESNVPAPKADETHLELPGSDDLLPSGFYYLWRPGL